MGRPFQLRDARQRIRCEIWIVLGLSLLPAAIYATISLGEALVRAEGIAGTTQSLNPAASELPVFDVMRRIAQTIATLVPVALAIWLLTTRRENGFARLGLEWRGGQQLRTDLRNAALLAAAIGVPGLLLYAGSRLLGATPQVVAGGDSTAWWAMALLVVAAARTAILEEIIAVGYLTTRLRALGWSLPALLAASAVLRGSYHLYQGVAMALGNVVMGLVFAWFYLRDARRDAIGRRSRMLPLIAAHFALDCVAFFGYPLAAHLWPNVF